FMDAWSRYLPPQNLRGRDDATTHASQGVQASRPTPGVATLMPPETYGPQGLSRCRDLHPGQERQRPNQPPCYGSPLGPNLVPADALIRQDEDRERFNL